MTNPIPKTAKPGDQSPLQSFEVVLKKASEKKASDVHLKAGLPPILRVNGQLYYLGDDDQDNMVRLTAEKIMSWAYALMNPRQKERYENGLEVDLGYEAVGAGRFRINICQQRSFPRLVCRYIPSEIKTVAELRLPPIVAELTTLQRGLVLVTGTTGSGKSTTLAAIIDHIARTRSCHIVTIEDPIEFSFKDRKSIVTQREVGMDTESFSKALKYALRQDPDVILVGEMRDEETMMMAMAAAETGHLVLSTLHTSDATETINRILSGISPQAQDQMRHQLASVLVAVVSQRLLRTAQGKGRIPAVEILISNARVKDMILNSDRTKDLSRAIEESGNIGMQSFDQSLMQLYKEGLITKEEALNHCTHFQDFQMRLDGVVPGEWEEKNDKQEKTRSEKVAELLKDGTAKPQRIEIEARDKKAS